MKNVKRIDEVRTVEGALVEIEITFEDSSKVVFKGEMKRKSGIMHAYADAKRIDEWKNLDGITNEIEITFLNGEKLVYTGENITRKGNL